MLPRRIVTALVLAAACHGCSMPPIPQGSMEEIYPAPPRPMLYVRDIEGAPLAWAEFGGAGSPPVLFVHGSPGDWKAWARYLVNDGLAGMGTRRAVDRPGFAGSAGSGAVVSLEGQARRLLALADPKSPPLVVGHSLGGPIAVRMAIDDPARVRGVLMIAGSISSQREGVRWYNRLAATPGLRAILPAEWRVSNQEMFALKPELERLEADLPRLRTPVILLQGEKDDLVDPKSVDDFVARVPNALVRVVKLPEMDHFLLWTHPEVVIRALEDLADWTRVTPASAAAPSPG